MTCRHAALTLALLSLALGCEAADKGGDAAKAFSVAGASFDSQRFIQYKLPKALREVSGLALTPDGTLLAHDDERAVIYRLSHAEGHVLGFFQLGAAAARDDFEGIAVAGDQVFLVTSSGSVYRAPLPAEDAAVDYVRYPAELPCEIEGLTAYRADALLAVCKNIHHGDDVLRGYLWSLTTKSYADAPLFSLDASAFAAVTPDLKKLRPSGITRTQEDHLLIVGRHGGDATLLELNADLAVIRLVTLPKQKRHPQPEGISITPERVLLLADEGEKGDNKRRGRLSVYRSQ